MHVMLSKYISLLVLNNITATKALSDGLSPVSLLSALVYHFDRIQEEDM